MRVTNFSISDSAVLNLSALRGQVDAAQQQISSGKRFTEASADAAATHGVMQNQSQLRAVTQYQRNVQLATSRATLEESALNQLGDILTRARTRTHEKAERRKRNRSEHMRNVALARWRKCTISESSRAKPDNMGDE